MKAFILAVVLVTLPFLCHTAELVDNLDDYYHLELLTNKYDLYWRILFPGNGSLPSSLKEGEVELYLVAETTGWFGLGINPNKTRNLMAQMDVIMVIANGGNVLVQDWYAQTTGNIFRDEERGETDDLTVLATSVENSVTRALVRRKIQTTKKLDKSITSGINSISFTIDETPDNQPTSMPFLRGNVDIDFIAGPGNTGTPATTGALSAGNLRALHGALMGISWGIINLIGLCIARYFRRYYWWLTAHRILMTIGTTGTFSMILTAFLFVSKPYETLTHAVVGTVIAGMTIVQITLGMIAVTKSNFLPFRKITAYTTPFHKFHGKVLVTLAVAQVYLGLVEISAPDSVKIFYYVYFGLFLLFIALLEVQHHYPEKVDPYVPLYLRKSFRPKKTRRTRADKEAEEELQSVTDSKVPSAEQQPSTTSTTMLMTDPTDEKPAEP